MRIEIDIPKEFEEHFKKDRFEDTLHRLSADAHCLAGRYERETAIMLIKAFAESKTAFDTEKVIAELKEAETDISSLGHYAVYADDAIKIVLKGGTTDFEKSN